MSKNLIYVGPADSATARPNNVERMATEADILPGMCLSIVATGFEKNSSGAAETKELLIIADKDQQRTRPIDEAWPINNNLVGITPASGQFFNVLVITGQVITADVTPIGRSATPGVFQIATPATDDVLFYASETITTTGTELVQVLKASGVTHVFSPRNHRE